MTKTAKRQRARAATAAQTSNAVTGHLSEERWHQIEELLQGLLFVYLNESFTDLDHLCPSQLQLVVVLSEVHAAAHENFERLLDRVLDAVALLCVHADALKEMPNLHADFWNRLLNSDMVMTSPCDQNVDDAVLVHKTVKYTRHYGVHVRFKWSNRALHPAVLPCINRFLNRPRSVHDINPSNTHAHPVRVTIALRSCQLRTREIRQLMDCLEIAQTPHSEGMLCAADSIEELDIRRNPLDTEELHALATLFESNSRRIDALNLSATFSTHPAVFNHRRFKAAFRRLMLAAFASQRPHHLGHGLALHLAHNNFIQRSHVAALQYALTQATRPLAGLSLAHINRGDPKTWLGLGHIFFSQDARAKSGDCWVDLTGINAYVDDAQSIRLSLSNAIAATIPRIRQAIVDGLPVYCRLMDTVDTESTTLSLVPALDNVSPAKLYPVLNAWQSEEHGGRGHFQVDITSSTDKQPVLVRVEPSEIGSVVIDGHVIVGSRFTSLKYHDSSDCAHAIVKLFKAIGPNLMHLSLVRYDGYYHGLGHILRHCSCLVDLNLTYVQNRVKELFQSDSFQVCIARLQALRIDGLYSLENRLVDLQTCLAKAPSTVALRSLAANLPHIKVVDLAAVRAMLQKYPSFECVEINAESKIDREEYTTERAAIETELQEEHISMRARVAFLGVLRGQTSAHLDQAVVSQIFAFAGKLRPRVVLWEKYKW